MKSWNEIKEEFEVDGSLRDIYVLCITPEVWDIFIRSVKSSSYRIEFFHDGASLDIPNSLSEIKKLQNTDPTILYIWLSEKIKVNCFFFIEEEIELDITPREIIGEHEYQILVGFLEWLANTLKERVILTHENLQDQVILSVG